MSHTTGESYSKLIITGAVAAVLGGVVLNGISKPPEPPRPSISHTTQTNPQLNWEPIVDPRASGKNKINAAQRRNDYVTSEKKYADVQNESFAVPAGQQPVVVKEIKGVSEADLSGLQLTVISAVRNGNLTELALSIRNTSDTELFAWLEESDVRDISLQGNSGTNYGLVSATHVARGIRTANYIHGAAVEQFFKFARFKKGEAKEHKMTFRTDGNTGDEPLRFEGAFRLSRTDPFDFRSRPPELTTIVIKAIPVPWPNQVTPKKD